uniref:Craniofacial development protein 2-like n=1 Tax=Angiostrongylus cantonensis TaxID=6313 RepID=A0A0K0DMF9_ANGCA
MVTIGTYNARTLAYESSIEDLLMQARMIRYDVIGLSETRRCHPFNANCDTGEELFFGTCNGRGEGGVGVHVNTSWSMNIRFIRTAYNRNRTFTIKKMWINTGFDNLRLLRANIKP